MRLGTLRPIGATVATIHPRSVPGPFVSDDISGIRRNVVTLRPTSRGKIIGQHPSVKRVLDTIDRVATSMCTVLVTGESGTGKELVVAALHDASTRRAGPLVTINCGAIPTELVESELFGHVKGAFTGAATSRRGHVAAAEGGTLFLDEVGELPLSAQVKLLRVLQQREYTPVGESRAAKCDVRIVAATNRDLKAEVAAGRFREDLYYRLNVIQLVLPALRERGTDVRVLAMHFYRGFVTSSGRSDLRGFSEEALAAIRGEPVAGQRARPRERGRARRAPRARSVRRGRGHPRTGGRRRGDRQPAEADHSRPSPRAGGGRHVLHADGAPSQQHRRHDGGTRAALPGPQPERARRSGKSGGEARFF